MTSRLGAAADLRFDQTVREFIAFVSELGLDHVEFKREHLEALPAAPPRGRSRRFSSRPA